MLKHGKQFESEGNVVFEIVTVVIPRGIQWLQ
jgi:hypothetical protein